MKTVKAEKVKGTDENVLAAIAWLLMPLSSIYFILEKQKYSDKKFLMYNAYLSAAVGVLLIGVQIMLGFAFYLRSLINLAAFFLWIYGMYKAYNKERLEIPVLSEWADKQV